MSISDYNCNIQDIKLNLHNISDTKYLTLHNRCMDIISEYSKNTYLCKDGSISNVFNSSICNKRNKPVTIGRGISTSLCFTMHERSCYAYYMKHHISFVIYEENCCYALPKNNMIGLTTPRYSDLDPPRCILELTDISLDNFLSH